jgi:serine/threonine-protein kinase
VTDPAIEPSGITLEVKPCPECSWMNANDMAFCPRCGSAQGDRERAGTSPTEPPPPPTHEADPLVGTVIADRYRMLSLVGRGGMGVVYKAEHVRIGKLMAIKLLHGELARDKDIVKRFKREADSASKLSHPNTVQIFDFGRSDNLMYLVMEYVAGRDLGWMIHHEHTLPFVRVARIAAQVCASLVEAHGIGLVHRDLKPENIMVVDSRSQPDFVKVLDFGLAKLRDQQGGDITRAGALVGTPYYMAPEHIRGETVDGRADLYAIGAMIYKAVCGVPPFTAQTPVGVLAKHLTETLVPPSERSPRKDLPPQCDDIVRKAMQRDPKDRYQRAEDFRDDLLAYLESVGEGFDSTTRLVTRAASGPRNESITTARGGRAVLAVATRGDVDRYETNLRRYGWVRSAVLLALLLGGAGAGAWVWKTHKPPIATTETEPNNEPATANALVPGHPVTAYLGRRISPAYSDADVYVLRNPGGAARYLRFAVTALPNMDLVVDVVRAGTVTPVLRADGSGRGGPEAVSAFPMDGPTYYLRVREYWRAGEPPTENVSDPYTIEWSFVTPGPDDETEVNDSPELSDDLRLGGSRRGHIGWNDDHDVYCLAEAATNVRASIEGVEGLDLVLESSERSGAVETRADANGLGLGETLPTIADAPAHITCFTVSATTERQGARANAALMYTLRLERGEPPPPVAPPVVPAPRPRWRPAPGTAPGAAATRAVPAAGPAAPPSPAPAAPSPTP